MEQLDDMAETLYGEFGFATCSSKEQTNLIELHKMMWNDYLFGHKSMTEVSELYGLKKSLLKKLGMK